MDEFKVNKRAPKTETKAPEPAPVTENLNLPIAIASTAVATRDAALKQLEQIKELAESLDFRKSDSDQKATGIVTSLRRAVKDMDKKREEIKSPYLKTCQSIDSLFRPITVAADTIIKGIKDRQVAHLKAQMEISRKAAEEAAKVAASSTATPEEKKFTEDRAIQKSMAASAPIQTSSGTAKVVTFWAFSIEDPFAVPAAFLKVDEEKIQRAIDSGVRTISGVKIFETVDVLYKTNRRK